MVEKMRLPPRVIFPISGDMVKDAASIRTIVVEALALFRSGDISIKDAYCIVALAKQAIDAMKLEYLFGPRVLYEGGKED